MKQIISKLRKCLCLTLSIFLLTSNTMVFGQERAEMTLIEDMNRLSNFSQEIQELKISLDKARIILEDPMQYLQEVHNKEAIYATDGFFYPESIKDFMRKYTAIKEEFSVLSASAYNIIGKGTLSELSHKYAHEPRALIPSVQKMLDISVAFPPTRTAYDVLNAKEPFYKIMSSVYRIGPRGRFSVTWINNEDLPKLIDSFQYFQWEIERMELGVKAAMKAKKELLRETFTPTEVMEYAYKNEMLPKEKAAIRLNLEVTNPNATLSQIIKSMRKYLTEFSNKIKTNSLNRYYPPINLGIKLKRMSLQERERFIEELTELKSSSKTFIKDFKKLDVSAQRYIGKNITGGAWTTVGLMVGLTLLFELIPQNSNANNINKSLEIVDALDDITYKIENGEATMAEMLYFYTIPENEDLILNDSVHTLNFVKLTSGVMAAEDLLEAEQEETKATNENVENSILQRYMEMQQNKKVNVGNVNVADFSF